MKCGGAVIVYLLLIGSVRTSPDRIQQRSSCNEILTESHGVLQTPGFPGPFHVPIFCRWVIDASNVPGDSPSIVIYLTQLYVFTGLTFQEYAHYDDTMRYGGSLIHTVTETNVTHVRWLRTVRPFLVVEFKLDRLEGNHLRVLDNLLDVYGFNITYEISTSERPVRPSSCIVVDCSFNGHCYTTADYTKFMCACFDGFSGTNCGQGPLCLDKEVCQNGGSCNHVGATAISCHCTPGFTGDKCDVALPDPGDSDCGPDGCLSQCAFDGKPEHVCNCPRVPANGTGKVRYESSIRLANPPQMKDTFHGQRPLEAFIEKQLAKYLRNSNLTKPEDLKVLNISRGTVVFHFFGAEKDSHRVREAMNKLMERGRLGNLTLVNTHISFIQEPTLLLKSVKINQAGRIREGDEFILSCIAQGSSHMTFRWYKDGMFVNVTKATRDIWAQLLAGTGDVYTAVLRIGKATQLDTGLFTCQVEEWGIQQCKSVPVEVLQPPEIKVIPMSVTVQKGENVNIKCMSPNDNHHEKFGYNWAKNHQLFRAMPGTEVWEDLYPAGSILKIYNVQKSTLYTCLVQGSSSRTVDVRVEVVNRSVVAVCGGDSAWPETAPGALSALPCPMGMAGTAQRLCTLRETSVADWDLPDYSGCSAHQLIDIQENFRGLTFGYQNTSASATINQYLAYLLNAGRKLLPSEGELVLSLVTDVVMYINKTNGTDEAPTVAHALYEIINILLNQKHSITSQQKIVQLQKLVRNQALIWASLPKASEVGHVSLDTIVLDVYTLESQVVNNIHMPSKDVSYPSWMSDKIDIRIETIGNGSLTVAIVVYKNLSEYLPARYVAQLKDGNDIQYEIISRIVSVDLGKDNNRFSPTRGLLWIDLELPHIGENVTDQGWNATCGVTDYATFSHTWDLEACHTRYVDENVTRCTCTKPGTFAVLWIHRKHLNEESHHDNTRQLLVLAGCTVCLILTLISLAILLPYWWHHRSCLTYLKLQCCTAVAGAMCVFIYALRDRVQKEQYQPISTFLQLFLLIAMSSHLSKLLIIYTDIVPFSADNLKQTVVGVNTGVPLLAVLINCIAYKSLNIHLNSWWLMNGSLNFVIFVGSTSIMVFLFVFIYFNLMRKLHRLVDKHLDKTKALEKRIGLLSRAAFIFASIVATEIASIVFVNISNEICYYVFCGTSLILGVTIFICYVLKCETSLYNKLVKKLKFENSIEENFSSESVNSPLNFFTKQDGEVETDSAAPPRLHEMRGMAAGHAVDEPTEDLLLAESGGKKYYRYPLPDHSSSTVETYVQGLDNTSDKYSSFLMRDLRNRVSIDTDVDLEKYRSSPKKYKHLPHMPPGLDIYSEYTIDPNATPKYSADFNSMRHYYPEGHLDPPIVRPGPGKCYLRDTSVPPEMLTTRVCVELGLVKSSQHNSEIVGAEANICVETPPNVMCSVDVEPMSEIVECVVPVICNGKDNKIKFSEQDDMSATESSSTSDINIPKIDITDTSLSEPSVSERKQPDGREISTEKTISDEQGEDNLDGMLDRISHDLDYLLNRTPSPDNISNPNFIPIIIQPATTHNRKTSKPPASSVRGQIREEDEENESTITVEDDSDIAKTFC